MKFLYLLWVAFKWKKLVFLSPCLIQFTQDRWAQYTSCFLNHSSSSLLAWINSLLCYIVGGAQVNHSIHFCKAFISFVPRWVLEAPQALNSELHPFIFNLTVSNAISPSSLLSHASWTTLVQSSHNNHASSNLNPHSLLSCRLSAAWLWRIKGRWSDACEIMCITVVLGNFNFQASLATALSKSSLVLATSSLLLFQVYG